jgi:hypothetical protein
MSFKSSTTDVSIYNDKKVFGEYPNGFIKNFMLAGEGDKDAFDKLINNYGFFTIGYDGVSCGSKKKECHAILWAAEAYHSVGVYISANQYDKRKQMFKQITDKCKDNQIKTILLNDKNSKHYFNTIQLDIIKNT